MCVCGGGGGGGVGLDLGGSYMAVLAGQRVLVSVCGSDPPDAGHLGARPYEPPRHQTSDVKVLVVCLTNLDQDNRTVSIPSCNLQRNLIHLGNISLQALYTRRVRIDASIQASSILKHHYSRLFL